MLSVTRRFAVLALAACAMAFAAPGAARADDGAEAYIQSLANRTFEILNNGASEAARREQLRGFISENIDFRRVAGFSLGKYSRQINADQKEEFITLFKEYVIGLYEDQLFRYSGQKLVVSGSIARNERDIIVSSIVDGEGSEFDDLKIEWRVLKGRDGGYSIFDVGAEGVWLVLAKQDEYTSYIANNGGGEAGMTALLGELRSQVGG